MIIGFLVGVASGLASAMLFWRYLLWVGRPRIEISSQISKVKDPNRGCGYRFRIKCENRRKRPAIDVRCSAELCGKSQVFSRKPMDTMFSTKVLLDRDQFPEISESGSREKYPAFFVSLTLDDKGFLQSARRQLVNSSAGGAEVRKLSEEMKRSSVSLETLLGVWDYLILVIVAAGASSGFSGSFRSKRFTCEDIVMGIYGKGSLQIVTGRRVQNAS